jgi:molecular chaperone DnaK
MGIAVGIDLGTTNTVVGVVRDGRAVTLADETGRRLIPSIVSFHPSGKVLVGDPAKERRIIDPGNTIYSIKRLIGRTWDTEEVQRARRALPFEIIEGPKQGVAISARGESYMLPEISAFILRRAKAVAEAALSQPVDRAVITVPANFNDLQRAATKLAGRLAGLEVLRILNEPTAAALAYGQAVGQAERIAVYDLGGGTFDITLLDLSGNVFEVLATGGDTALGGDDIDQLIADEMALFFLQTYRTDPRVDPSALATLRARAEALKIALSSEEEAEVDLSDVARGEDGAYLPAAFSMTRAELERIVQPLIDRTLETCRASIDAIEFNVGEVERVILVGGSTRMPLVARKVEEYFRKPATRRVNPDEVVALGAAIQAGALSRVGRERSIAPRLAGSRPPSEATRAPLYTPPPVVVQTAPPPSPPSGRYASVRPVDSSEALTPLAPSVQPRRVPTEFDAELDLGPTASSKPPPFRRAPPPPRLPTFELPSPSRPQPSLAPSPRAPTGPPSVSQKSPPPILRPGLTVPPRPSPLLIDVTPISLGVETAGGYCDFLIEANTPVPCDRTRVFRTASDGQSSVVVKVAQGDSEKFQQNTYLGDLHLSGLKPAPRGEVQVAVTFEIDVDGILNVRAKDEGSGRETVARMHMLGTHSEAGDVQRMMARQSRQDLL